MSQVLIHSTVSQYSKYWVYTVDLNTRGSNHLFQLEASPDTSLSIPHTNFSGTLFSNLQNAEEKPRTHQP